jgi:putative transposase
VRFNRISKKSMGWRSSENERAKFWLSVLTVLQNRGVKNILIACVDGLKGFPKAIETVFPKTLVQICIVHQIRNSPNFVSHKDRKEVAQDLKPIYTAATAEEALLEKELFAEKWNAKYPLIAKSGKMNWGRIEPMFQFPQEIRRAIYTNNVIESLNMSLRKITKTEQPFHRKKPPSN